MILQQRTIAKKVAVAGIGIHTGKKVTVTFYPASAGEGINFKRTDLPNAPVVKASAANVSATRNNTTIGEGIFAIHTVEHLLAVLYGLGIDNLYCEIDGPEVPTMDGSGASFAFLIKETGITELNANKEFLIVTDKIRVESGDSWAEIEPAESLVMDSTVVFAHPLIKRQQKIFNFSCENFINEICRARTFGFLKDFDMLKRMGLAKGGSLDNAVVLDDFRVLNADGLRFKDEFIRHKILDAIGDFSLLGHEIAAKITTYKAGHNINNMLCRKLLATEGAYKIVSSSDLRREAVEAFELPRAMAPVFH